MNPICVFFHCLFQIGDTLLPCAVEIVMEQMHALKASGLEDEALEIIVGINGGVEASAFSDLFPAKATIVYHGLQCRNELRTILLMEQFAREHPDWHVLYHHSKNATHAQAGDRGSLGTRWRRCMERACVWRWRECVELLAGGYDAVGVHWMTRRGSDRSQNYFAGTFFWVTSNFLNTLPSIMERARIRISGLDSIESRFEAEVKLCNGPRLPCVKDMDTSHPIMACPDRWKERKTSRKAAIQ